MNIPILNFFKRKPRADSGGSSTFFEGANQYSNKRSYVILHNGDSRHTYNAGSRKTMMGISRYLAANLGVVRGVFGDMARYSCIGKPQSQSTDIQWRESAEEWLNEWMKIPEVTGRWSWQDIDALMDVAADRDGDMGMILTDNDFPQLQLVESHRIDDLGYMDTVDGVRVNGVGRPLSYRIVTDPEKRTYRDIPADSFILYFEPDRMDQFRGISALHAGLNHGRDIGDINSFLKQMVKNESAIAVIKKVNGGDAEYNDWAGNTANTTAAATDQILETIYGGQIPRLGEGEAIESFASDRPSQNVQDFLSFLIRDICIGMGVPYEFVWDAAKLTGPSQRFIMTKAQKRFEQRQRRKIRVSNRIIGWAVAKAAKRGDIPKLPADWYRWTWQVPARVTIDVGREAAQDRADLQAGAITFAEFLGRQGIDFDEHIQRRAMEAKRIQDECDKAGVPVWMVYQSTPNGNPGDWNGDGQQDGTETSSQKKEEN